VSCCIVIGLMLSLILQQPEDKVNYQKMVAPITQQEQEFMEAFGIDDGDGSVNYKEYVILIAVRIGTVPPHLVNEIQNRFKMLDRKGNGEISYNDLVLPPKKMTSRERIHSFTHSALKSFNNSSCEVLPGELTTGGNGAITTTTSVDQSKELRSKAPLGTVSSSKKVSPAPIKSSGDIIVIPRSASTPTPTRQVCPAPSSTISSSRVQHEVRDKVDDSEEPPYKNSASVDALECIEWPNDALPVLDTTRDSGDDGVLINNSSGPKTSHVLEIVYSISSFDETQHCTPRSRDMDIHHPPSK
jgi:Ca2+-binding EF-hand superfamily protein